MIVLKFGNSSEAVEFRRPVINRLIKVLESHRLPNLSENEQAHLIVLIQTTLEVSSCPCPCARSDEYIADRRATPCS